jgi:hypothetical protein
MHLRMESYTFAGSRIEDTQKYFGLSNDDVFGSFLLLQAFLAMGLAFDRVEEMVLMKYVFPV